MKKGKLGAILLALVLIIGLVCCVVCLEKIPAGYVGVVYNMNGGVDGEVLEQGWHLVAPTKKVTKYSIGIEQSYLTAEDKGDSPKDESFNIPTSDVEILHRPTVWSIGRSLIRTPLGCVPMETIVPLTMSTYLKTSGYFFRIAPSWSSASLQMWFAT